MGGRPRLEGYRKLVAFGGLLGYLGWLAYMGVADGALGTLSASAVTAFGLLVTGHVVQQATARAS